MPFESSAQAGPFGWNEPTFTFAPGADWDTVKLAPPIATVAARAAPVFGATEKVIVPVPTIAAPLVTVTNGRLLDTEYAQVELVAVTVMDPVPPALVDT